MAFPEVLLQRRPPTQRASVAGANEPSAAVSLDDAQRMAVAARGPVVRVVGGPGTGKTTVAIETVVRRVLAGDVEADQCVLLTSTRSAAAALRDAVTVRLGGTSTQTLARTWQAFGFGVLRAEAALAGDPPPTLLNGPEQDVILRELLAGHAADGSGPQWPEGLELALATRGFRQELRDLLMRAVELGLDFTDLADLGVATDRPEWVAAARVLREYDEVTAFSRAGAYDPAWILTAVADRLEEDPDAVDRLRDQVKLVVVDDAQEVTTAAARLLGVLARAGIELVLVGDPDAAVQTFRGADPSFVSSGWRQLLSSPETEMSCLLTQTHRIPAGLLPAVERIRSRIGAAGEVGHRALSATDDGGSCAVAVLRSVHQEAAYVAHALRRAHLDEGIPYADLAVIVRGGSRSGTLRRVLGAQGIPVTAASGDLPVRDEPAVRPLLMLLQLVLDVAMWRDEHSEDDEVDAVPPIAVDTVVDLLLSVLGDTDAVGLRALRRGLRAAEIEAGGQRSSDDLLVAALLTEPSLRLDLGSEKFGLDRLARAVAAGVRAAARSEGRWARGVNAESLLWALWDALGLAETWRARALRGDSAAAERADRNLDAVVALFDTAGRFVDRLPASGPDAFLSHLQSQDVPGDSLVARAPSADRVAVLTPASAAGRQWRRVIIAGVQEGVWPDLRLRGSILGSADLVAEVKELPHDPRSAGLAIRHDETRLFYVALTRASEGVLITAVRGEDEQPSAFLDLVDPLPVGTLRQFTNVEHPLTLVGLVGKLRRDVASVDPRASDRAAVLLAELARLGVPGADPDSWWTVRPTTSDAAIFPPEHTVTISPSKLERFGNCPVHWLLESCGGEGPSIGAADIGTLVHSIAATNEGASADELIRILEERWHELSLPAGWVTEQKRDNAHAMMRNLARFWSASQSEGWRLGDVEIPIDATVGRAQIRGTVDRVEVRHPAEGVGELRLLDYKTGSSKPTKDKLREHPQLAAYQLAAVEGGLGPAYAGAEVAGAALVQLGKAARATQVDLQPQERLSESDNPRWAHELVAEAADGMASATFVATPGEHCRICALRSSCPAQPEGRGL